MDVIAMPESGAYYRVMPSHKGLYLAPISKDESNFSLLRVENKSTVHNGVQIALHDGSILLVKVADPKKPIEVTYETFDVLKVTYPDKTVTQVLKTKEGNIAVITGGKNIGKMGKIVEIEKTEAKKRRQPPSGHRRRHRHTLPNHMDFDFLNRRNRPSCKFIGGIRKCLRKHLLNLGKNIQCVNPASKRLL